MSNEQSGRVATMRQFLAAFNRHDVDAIMAFFTDDCIFDMPRGSEPGGRRLIGRDAVREGIANRFAGLPDAYYGDDHHWANGNRGVSEWTITGTTSTGTHIEVRGCDLFEFRGDKILRKDSYWKIVE